MAEVAPVNPAIVAAANPVAESVLQQAAPDYAAMLLGPEPVEAAAAENGTKATDGTEATSAEKAPTPPPVADSPVLPVADSTPPPAGTPDKVLQRMQQDLAAATRQIEALTAKADAGATLTAKEQANAAAAQRKLTVIRDALRSKGEGFDLLDHAGDVGAALVETDDAVQGLRAEVDAAKAELARLRQAGEAQANATATANLQAAYPKVDVPAVWAKACADALDMLGVADAAQLDATPALAQAARNAANRLFHQRADAAAKSVAAVAAKEPPKAAAAAKPPVTPGGARVAQATGAPATGNRSPEGEWMSNALALVMDDN